MSLEVSGGDRALSTRREDLLLLLVLVAVVEGGSKAGRSGGLRAGVCGVEAAVRAPQPTSPRAKIALSFPYAVPTNGGP